MPAITRIAALLRAAALAALAVLPALSSAGCTDDAATCHDSLPDLDGDGALTDADCALRDDAAVVRRVCETDRALWRTADACAAEVTARLDGLASGAIEPSVRALPDNGHGTMFAVASAGALHLVTAPDPPVPAGQVGPLDSAVWQVSTAPGPWGPAITGVGVGHERSLVATSTAAWIDTDDDHALDAGERVALDPLGAGASIATMTGGGEAIVAVLTPAQALTIWRDRDRDGRIATSETVPVGGVTGVLGVGDAWIAYWRLGAAQYLPLEPWPPDPAAARALAVEPWCEVYFEPGVCRRGAALAVRDPETGAWRETRLPGGTRRIDWYGTFTFQVREPLVGPVGWQDRNGDLAMQDAEVSALPSASTRFLVDAAILARPGPAGGVGDIVGVRLENLDDTSTVTAVDVIARRRTPATRFAGDPCDDAAPCALGLVCRGSGDAPEPRCTAPPR